MDRRRVARCCCSEASEQFVRRGWMCMCAGGRACLQERRKLADAGKEEVYTGGFETSARLWSEEHWCTRVRW